MNFSNNTFLLLLIVIFLLISWIDAHSLKYKVNKIKEHLKKEKTAWLTVTDDTYDLFAKGQRNYSLVLLATALDSRIGCDQCRLFHPDFQLVAQSYESLDGGDLYFGIVDFGKGRQVFAELELQSAPVVFHFPPSMGDDNLAAVKKDRWDPTNGMSAEMLSKWIEQIAPSHPAITIRRPFNYQKLFVTLVVLATAGALIKLFYEKLERVYLSKYVWAVGSLVFIINMSSGYMWNQIRNAPYSGQMDGGKVQLVMPGMQGQYQIETQLVGALYALLSACIVVLVQRIPSISSASSGITSGSLWQRIGTVMALVTFVGGYEVLISLFRYKNGGGYPFSMTPF